MKNMGGDNADGTQQAERCLGTGIQRELAAKDAPRYTAKKICLELAKETS